jgi:hypothetical protein
MHVQHYDGERGWLETTPGWHEVRVNYLGHVNWIAIQEKHDEVITWLYANIDKCERHCRWNVTPQGTRVKFRYERDYIWFNLTWG